jgi:hypothetical protein
MHFEMPVFIPWICEKLLLLDGSLESGSDDAESSKVKESKRK